MPKMKNVTAADLGAVLEAALDISADAGELASRIERGYRDQVIPEMVTKARGLQAAARSLLDLSSQLLMQAALEEQRAELEALIRARQATP